MGGSTAHHIDRAAIPTGALRARSGIVPHPWELGRTAATRIAPNLEWGELGLPGTTRIAPNLGGRGWARRGVRCGG